MTTRGGWIVRPLGRYQVRRMLWLLELPEESLLSGLVGWRHARGSAVGRRRDSSRRQAKIYPRWSGVCITNYCRSLARSAVGSCRSWLAAR